MANEVTTPTGVLSFPHLFTPKPRAQGSDPVYSLSLIFDEAAQAHPNYKALKDEVMRALIEEFGADKAKDPKFVKSLQLPFKDAGEKDYEGYGSGKIFISAWTKTKPQIVDRHGNLIDDAKEVWAGQRVRVSLRAFGYSNSGNKGVSFYLEHVLMVSANQPRIDGRASAKQRFADVDLSDELEEDDLPF